MKLDEVFDSFPNADEQADGKRAPHFPGDSDLSQPARPQTAVPQSLAEIFDRHGLSGLVQGNMLRVYNPRTQNAAHAAIADIKAASISSDVSAPEDRFPKLSPEMKSAYNGSKKEVYTLPDGPVSVTYDGPMGSPTITWGPQKRF